MELFAFGLGVGTKNRAGEWLEVWFPRPLLNPTGDEVKQIAQAVGYGPGDGPAFVAEITASKVRATLARLGEPYASLTMSSRPAVAVFLAADAPMSTVPEAYLKLHLLSHRLVKPRTVDLTGIFKVLPNVAWTNRGAVDPADLPDLQISSCSKGELLSVESVDKFPKMTDYVVPSGVRIADASRVRLGAYVGPGTTVMQEGFINFNAGTEGPNMIEGRVSSSVWVGAGTDVGGGASIMGVLSGGGTTPITLGKNCLLGANSGLGIPLGDDCTVESGLYVTAASKVRILGPDKKPVKTVKAKDLAGRSNLLFWRNSLDGAIECLPNKAGVQLNQDLHSNQ